MRKSFFLSCGGDPDRVRSLRWVERLRVVGLQRSQQQERQDTENAQMQSSRLTTSSSTSSLISLGDGNMPFDDRHGRWSSSSSSSLSVVPPRTPRMEAQAQAVSPEMSCELGGLDIGGVEGDPETPKIGLKSLPEERLDDGDRDGCER